MSSNVKKNWLKCFGAVVYWLLIFGVTGYLIFAITNECFSQPRGLYYEVFEDVCYVLCAFCLFNVCYSVNKRIEKWRYKALVTILSAAVTTALVFFLNNLWKYQSFNAMFGWENPLGYSHFLKSDLTYTIGFAEFRYPLLFVGVLILSLFGCWVLPKLKTFMSTHSVFECLGTPYSLDDYVNRYMNNSDYFEMLDYLQQMPASEKTKQELIDAIYSYDIVELYDVLFDKCSEFLTPEEREQLKLRYERTFENNINSNEDFDATNDELKE